MPRSAPSPRPAAQHRPRRLYLPDALGQPVGTRLELLPSQKRHLITTLRHRAGDEVIWFDGVTATGRGKLVGSERAGFSVELLTREAVGAGPVLTAELVLALPRRDSLPQCVELATIAGVGLIRLTLTDHSPYRLPADQWPALMIKLCDVAVNACEQCGRFSVPSLEVVRLEEALGPVSGTLACAESEVSQLSTPSTPPLREGPLNLAIGPEGGWSVRELAAFDAAGWTPWHVPGATLTTVAACAILPALWRHGNQ